ncbi:MAG: hypothetical protein JSR99_03455 [Proteobacteria bacterium]|nr:hypothetical protein [Pseudomonadota bacterium]
MEGAAPSDSYAADHKCGEMMGPKLAINLLALGLGGTLLLVFEGLMSGTLGDQLAFIAIPVVMAIVGGVRILQLRR